MKLNLPAVLLIFAGAVLIYSGTVRRDPRNVVLEALGSKRRVGGEGTGKAVGDAVGNATGKIGDSLGGVPNSGTRPAHIPKPGVPVVSV